MEYIFTENVKGSHNGFTVIEHRTNDIVDAKELSPYLTKVWLEKGIIQPVEECNEDCNECDETTCLKHPVNNDDDEAEEEIPEENEERFAMLIGSSILPSIVNVEEKQVQLGTIVAQAHAMSNLSVDEWNDLPDEEREQRLADHVEWLRSAYDSEVVEEGEEDAKVSGEVGEDENDPADNQGEGEKDDNDPDNDEDDDNPLLVEAKAIIESESPDIDRLKEIGIALEVENIDRCTNPDTIIKKVKEAIEA